MMETLRKMLYEKAIRKWGRYLQMDVLVEECSELIKAMMKYRRHPNDSSVMDRLLEEMADVEIMIEQWKFVLDYKEHSSFSTTAFESIKEQKLKRLEKRLK